jgi:NRAMP (natural resistance-associated macrophage protein)-like metal ion transporter
MMHEPDQDHSFPLVSSWWGRLREHPLARIGPGLITGVADDDPSGIATYSQAGAQYGLDMLWTMIAAFPLMAAIQLICARIGRVTGRGLAANIKLAFSPLILRGVVLLLLIANIFNIAADVAAMGETAELVTGFDRHILTLVFVMGTVLLQVFVPYHRYVFFLKWLTLSLLAYAAVLFTVHVPWGDVVWHSFIPQMNFDREWATVVVGVFGTTISPYLFFWQASEEVEDMRAHQNAAPLVSDGTAAPMELQRIKWDTWSGMFYSDVTAYFIILATAVTLHVAGITKIETAAQAASALRPLAGDFSFFVFAIGILGVGLIGVPVLAGSAAYAICETMGWEWGLERRATDARGFYGVIAISVFSGLLLQYMAMSPMQALFWSAVLNGLVAVPLMVVIIVLVSRPSIMGAYTAPRYVLALGWLATIVMGIAALMMFLPN